MQNDDENDVIIVPIDFPWNFDSTQYRRLIIEAGEQKFRFLREFNAWNRQNLQITHFRVHQLNNIMKNLVKRTWNRLRSQSNNVYVFINLSEPLDIKSIIVFVFIFQSAANLLTRYGSTFTMTDSK